MAISQNGFIDRILFVISSNIQKQYWSESEVSESIIKDWHTIVNNLLKLTVENDDTLNPNPTILKFTPEARRFLFDWQKQNADNCNNAETEAISGIHSKLEMYATRLALILELIKYACKNGDKQAVESDSVNGSLRLIEYFKNSALKIHAIISNSNPLEKHPADRQAIYKALQDTFTTEEGVQLAESMEMPERTFKRFLNETDLFTRTSRGKYEKRF